MPTPKKSSRKRGFFSTLRAALWSPAFYAQIATQRTFGQAFGYFIGLTALFSLLMSSLVFIFLWFGLGLNHSGLEEQLRAIFPEELVITIENGQVSSNVAGPYFISFPEKWQAFSREGIEEKMPHLAVIDTQTPFSLEQFETYEALLWLSSNNLFVYDPQGFRGISLGKIEQFTFDKDHIDSLDPSLGDILKWIFPLFMIGIGVGLFIFYMGWGMLYLLFLATLLQIIGTVFKVEMKYSEAYRMSFYAMTIAYVTQLLATNLTMWTNFRQFPFMITVIVVALVGLNLKNAKA